MNVNGFAVLTGTASLPAGGAWVADLSVDTAELLPTTPRGVTLDLGGQTLVGTVTRQGVHAARLSARIVGGANGLSTTLPAKKYRNVPLSVPLADIATETGELLATTIATAVRSFPLAHYSRTLGPASHALRWLAAAAGVRARILPDGSLWLGVDDYPEAVFTGDVLKEQHGGAWRQLAPNAGTVLPATTLLEQRIESVAYKQTSGALRVEVWAA